MAEFENVNVKVCRTCGARYSTPGVAASHTRATGHHDWKTVKEKREKQPSRISYQHGYGPKEHNH
jgi:hypothetical protein